MLGVSSGRVRGHCQWIVIPVVGTGAVPYVLRIGPASWAARLFLAFFIQYMGVDTGIFILTVPIC